MCVNLFFVKVFSGTNKSRILKFGTNVGYNCLSFPLFVHFSFSPVKNSVTDFSASVRAKVFKFCIHLENGQVFCGKENRDAENNFCLLFPFFLFTISQSNVIHREICVKDFPGTAAPRIFKFGTNVVYDLLHCVRENQPPDMFHFLYFSTFLSIQSNFLLEISRRLWEPESSNFLYTSRVDKYIMGQKTKMLRFIFIIFFHLSFFHLSLQCIT